MIVEEKYLFGDSNLAARRLAVLADAFASSSRAFMVDQAGPGPLLAVDLGCGTGHTTHLLADALSCEETVGLDNSEHFVGLAGKTATADISFELCDVTTLPFPCGPRDVIYGRFLLTHQIEPEVLPAAWGTQLDVGGRMLLEEVESIQTTVEPFTAYLTIVEAMLAAVGHDLYVGRRLGSMPTLKPLIKRMSRIVRVPITNDLAARMFSMNIRTWKQNTFVREHHTPESIAELQQALTDLAATPTHETDIEWSLRQLAFERTD